MSLSPATLTPGSSEPRHPSRRGLPLAAEPAARALPMTALRSRQLTELQAAGLRWLLPDGPGLSRTGGAGPSDHKAILLFGQTVMVPIFTGASRGSPFSARPGPVREQALLYHHDEVIAELSFPVPPRFYARSTRDGIPYWKLATLHSTDVLATTVLQTCTRYGNRSTSCQFCAIGRSLAARTTIAEKSPAQLAEVARAAVELDGVAHIVMTTGTPPTPDRGAAVLAAAGRAIKEQVQVPIQAQCEPPADFGWFERLRDAGIDTLGMHLEAVTDDVRLRIMPGKAEVPLETYFSAFEAAVKVFGRAQVSTYILAGLGDPASAILLACERLIGLGVYPFVVPFVPIGGTPLESHPTPSPAFMQALLDELGQMLGRANMKSTDAKAGCGRCGACSTLRAREQLYA